MHLTTLDHNASAVQAEPLATPSLSNALLDGVSFGIEATISGISAHTYAQALRPYRTDSNRDRYDENREWFELVLSVPVYDPAGFHLGSATATLFLRSTRNYVGFRIDATSAIHLNPMRLLGTKQPAFAGHVSLDGKANLIGPHPDDARPLLASQLAMVEVAINAVADVMAAALGQDYIIHTDLLRLRHAELCRDAASTDALQLVRRLQRSWLAGTAIRKRDIYRFGAEEDDRGVPVVRWWWNLLSPVAKVYAKQAGLVRTEVTCLNRDAVNALLDGPPVGPIDGSEAVHQLMMFATAAEPALDKALGHVADVDNTVRPIADLVFALLPLIEFGAQRRHGAGKKPGKLSIDQAKAALTSLIEDGVFHATAMPKTGALRKALDLLCQPGGPLVHEGRLVIYAVRPEFIAVSGGSRLAPGTK